MPNPPVTNTGVVSKALPAANADGQNVSVRQDKYGGQYVSPYPSWLFPLAESGELYRVSTPTPGTGVSYTVSASFSDTVPMIQFYNTSATKNVWLARLKLVVTVAGASGTTFQYAVKTDSSARAMTTVHGIAAVPSPLLVGAGASVTSVVYQNNSTASAIPAASGAAIIAAEGAIGGITIVGDEITIAFGASEPMGWNGLTAAQASDPGSKISVAPPVVMAPGWGAVFYCWMANNTITALSYSFEALLIER